jgi:limonene-1,2-epoxide hydrolase
VFYITPIEKLQKNSYTFAMVKIHVQPDCGNAPKMGFIRDFEVAFAEQKLQVILDSIADDIYWEMVGNSVVQGKAEAKKMVETMLDGSIAELTIENIITHGDSGAVNGVMKFVDGTTFAFCDVFTFTSHAKDAKIKKLSAYLIEINKK